MYKVSVILPIFNAGKYLEEALNSIIGQTEKNLEIICVDDGSTDESVNIMDEYAAKHSNIVVIHKSNSGYGDTVNKGIDIANANYIGIVEPDDYISSNMYEKLYENAINNNLDWVKGDYACFWNNKGEKKVEFKKIIEKADYYNRIIKPTEDKDIFRGSIMNPSGIYRKSFLDDNNIRHNITPGASYQDLGFWFQIMTKSKRGMLLDDIFYYYRQDNEESSMNNRGKIYCICDEYSNLRKKIANAPNPILTQCMFATYTFTYKERIAVEYREDFLERYKKDFLSLMEDGLYDESLLLEDERKELKLVIFDSDNYYKDTMRLSEELAKKLENTDEFIIYGAGYFAKKICHELKMELREKLKGFVVTSETHENELMGKDIYNVSELQQKKKYDVLLGVTDKYRDEVLEILNNYQTKSVIVVGQEYC